jgi:hypothetical protein
VTLTVAMAGPAPVSAYSRQRPAAEMSAWCGTLNTTLPLLSNRASEEAAVFSVASVLSVTRSAGPRAARTFPSPVVNSERIVEVDLFEVEALPYPLGCRRRSIRGMRRAQIPKSANAILSRDAREQEPEGRCGRERAALRVDGPGAQAARQR